MTGKLIGYIRVSTIQQNLERQLEGLKLDRSFIDKVSGKSIDRPALQETAIPNMTRRPGIKR